MKTSAAPYPERRNPIVVYLMSSTQRVRALVTYVTANNGFRSIVQLMLLQHGYCTFVTILFWPFAGLFINLAMRMRALFSESATTLGLAEQAFWRVPFFYIMNWCKFLWGNPCRAIETFHHWDFPLGLRVLDAFLSFCRVEELGDGFGCVDFARLLISWRAIVSFRALPVRFPLPTISQTSLFTLFCPLILDHGVSLLISVSGPKIPVSLILLDTSFHHCLQSVIIRS